jgi:cob(I)alamin adenosyltransferase
MEAIGTLDEATAALGFARSLSRSPLTAPLLLAIQRDLYHIMAETAATLENSEKFRKIDAGRVTWLEEQTDILSSQVSLPNEFILPGDSTGGGSLALARTIVRRAERHVAQLIHSKQLENQELLRYLNRLSSLCFVLEIFENQIAGQQKPTLAKLPEV